VVWWLPISNAILRPWIGLWCGGGRIFKWPDIEEPLCLFEDNYSTFHETFIQVVYSSASSQVVSDESIRKSTRCLTHQYFTSGRRDLPMVYEGIRDVLRFTRGLFLCLCLFMFQTMCIGGGGEGTLKNRNLMWNPRTGST